MIILILVSGSINEMKQCNMSPVDTGVRACCSCAIPDSPQANAPSGIVVTAVGGVRRAPRPAHCRRRRGPTAYSFGIVASELRVWISSAVISHTGISERLRFHAVRPMRTIITIAN